MSEAIIKQWLAEVSRTVAVRDLNAHLDLISRKVKLTGVPGFELIDYSSWAKQCEHEFSQQVIESVRYDGLQLGVVTPSHIMFKTFETVSATDGRHVAQGIEVLLEKETDGKWRVVQERILPDEERLQDGLGLPAILN